MTEQKPASNRFIRRTASGLICATALALTLAGCNREEGVDYCKDHYQVHAEHADTIGKLHGTLDADGLLTMRLSLPASVMASVMMASAQDGSPAVASDSAVLPELLRSPEQVYSLETAEPCADATVKMNELSQGLELEYQSQCGAGNRVKQVNVELFALLEGLEEVEVQVDTAAASKHFAISRLCKQAIFRLKKPGQD